MVMASAVVKITTMMRMTVEAATRRANTYKPTLLAMSITDIPEHKYTVATNFDPFPAVAETRSLRVSKLLFYKCCVSQLLAQISCLCLWRSNTA